MKSDSEIQKVFSIKKEGNDLIYAHFSYTPDVWTPEEDVRCVELEIKAAEEILKAHPNTTFNILLNILELKDRHGVREEGMALYAEFLKNKQIGKVAHVTNSAYMSSLMHFFMLPQNKVFLDKLVLFDNLEEARTWLDSLKK